MDRFRAAVARATEEVAAVWVAVSSRTRAGSPSWFAAEDGQGLAEYALILGLIAVVAIASLTFLGGTITELLWDPISDDFGAVLSRLGL
jgi:pilus assembly protein Flp/PilA